MLKNAGVWDKQNSRWVKKQGNGRILNPAVFSNKPTREAWRRLIVRLAVHILMGESAWSALVVEKNYTGYGIIQLFIVVFYLIG